MKFDGARRFVQLPGNGADRQTSYEMIEYFVLLQRQRFQLCASRCYLPVRELHMVSCEHCLLDASQQILWIVRSFQKVPRSGCHRSRAKGHIALLGGYNERKAEFSFDELFL